MHVVIHKSAHENVMLDSQVPNFILTNPYDGITEELADKAMSILND